MGIMAYACPLPACCLVGVEMFLSWSRSTMKCVRHICSEATAAERQLIVNQRFTCRPQNDCHIALIIGRIFGTRLDVPPVEASSGLLDAGGQCSQTRPDKHAFRLG